MLNCTSETRRWAEHVTALQTSTDGNAKTSSRSSTRPKSTLSDHGDCPICKKKLANATDKCTHQKMTWTKRHTHNKKFNWRINKSKSYFRFWATTSTSKSRRWTAHVIALQMSADGRAMTSQRSKSRASMKPFVISMDYVQITCYTKSRAEILTTSDQRTLLCTHDLCVIQSGRVTVPQCGTKPSWNKNIAWFISLTLHTDTNVHDHQANMQNMRENVNMEETTLSSTS